MLLYEHLFSPNKKKSTEMFPHSKKLPKKQNESFSVILQQRCMFTHAGKEGSFSWGSRHRHPYAYGHAPLLGALWRAPRRVGGLHGCKMSPSQSTVFGPVSLLQPFRQRTAFLSATYCTTALWSKALSKAASSLSATLLPPLGCRDLPASPT